MIVDVCGCIQRVLFAIVIVMLFHIVDCVVADSSCGVRIVFCLVHLVVLCCVI